MLALSIVKDLGACPAAPCSLLVKSQQNLATFRAQDCCMSCFLAHAGSQPKTKTDALACTVPGNILTWRCSLLSCRWTPWRSEIAHLTHPPKHLSASRSLKPSSGSCAQTNQVARICRPRNGKNANPRQRRLKRSLPTKYFASRNPSKHLSA